MIRNSGIEISKTYATVCKCLHSSSSQNMIAILNGFIGINTLVPFYKYFVLLTHEEKQIA